MLLYLLLVWYTNVFFFSLECTKACLDNEYMKASCSAKDDISCESKFIVIQNIYTFTFSPKFYR